MSLGQRTEPSILPTPGEWWRWFRATAWLTCTAVLAILALTVLVILFYPRTYHSSARVLLRLGRESVTLDPTAAASGQTMPFHKTREDEMKTVLGVMDSRELLVEVVEEVGAKQILTGYLSGSGEEKKGLIGRLLKPILAIPAGILDSIDPVDAKEEAVVQLKENLDIDAEKSSSVVTVEYQSKSPELSQAVLTSWMNAYTQTYSRVNSTPQSVKFFVEQLEGLQEEIQARSSELSELKNKYGLVSIDGQRLILEGEMSRVRSQLNDADADWIASEAMAAKLQERLSKVKPQAVLEEAGGTRRSVDTMRSQLFTREIEEQELLSKYTVNHPLVRSVQREVEGLRDLLKQQDAERDDFVKGMNPTFLKLESELELEISRLFALSEKKKEINGQLESLKREMQSLNTHGILIAESERKIEVLETQFYQQSGLLKQARNEEELWERKISSVRVVQPPSLEQRPIAPKKSLCALFGGFASMVTLVGIPLFLGPRAVSKKLGILGANGHSQDRLVGGVSHAEGNADGITTVKSNFGIQDGESTLETFVLDGEDTRNFEPFEVAVTRQRFQLKAGDEGIGFRRWQ